MKTSSLVLALTAVLLLATGVLAQPLDPRLNEVGLYFDTGGTSSTWTVTAPGSVYVVLTRPDLGAGLDAWDLAVRIEEALQDGWLGTFHLPSSAPPASLFIHQDDDYACAYNEPIAVIGSAYVLMQAEFGWNDTPADPGYACFTLSPAEANPEVPGQISLLLSDDTVMAARASVDGVPSAWIGAPGCGDVSGTLIGFVRSQGEPLADLSVTCRDQADEIVFQTMTDARGLYAAPEPVAIGTYTVMTESEFYTTFTQTLSVATGINLLDIELAPTPYGSVHAQVLGEGQPLTDVTVTVLDAGGELVFTEVSDDTGWIAGPDLLLLGDYVFQAETFAFEPYEQTFSIHHGENTLQIELVPTPRGVLSGRVTDAVDGLPLPATVSVRRADDATLIDEIACGVDGRYATDPLPYFDYVATAQADSHEVAVVALTIGTPSITRDFTLEPIPYGVLIGRVTDAVSGRPLAATVRLRHADIDTLIGVASCDTDGWYATDPLPFRDYTVTARADSHEVASASVTIGVPLTTQHFVLEPANGYLLLIDDDPAEAMTLPDKHGGKHGDQRLAPGYRTSAGRSAEQLRTDLEGMGYAVELTTMNTVDPTAFAQYDVVVVSCGDNIDTLADEELRAGLVAFALDGGHLLLEGGELGFNQFLGDTQFTRRVLHVDRWEGDEGGDIVVRQPETWILNHPNRLTAPLGLTYTGYGDADEVTVTSDAAGPLGWSIDGDIASVVTYDPNPAPAGGQIVYFAFNYLAADPGRLDLLDNAIHWLLEEEIGTAQLTGTALLVGAEDHSGVTLSLCPGQAETTTDYDGSFRFDDLVAGSYRLTAHKPGWTSVAATVVLQDDAVTTVDLILTPNLWDDSCSEPGLPIVDLTEVSDTIYVSAWDEIEDVRVFVDISHSWRGDLHVTLIAPSGTMAVLHGGSGGEEDDLYGWYPLDLEPIDNLAIFRGQSWHGVWTLSIYDDTPGDEGVLNAWCLDVPNDDPIPVGVHPLQVRTAGGLQLSWQYDPAVCDGFNLYRRTDTTPRRRLNDVLLSSPDGRISFTDDGDDLLPGQSVYYSYALVAGGVETGFGDEVEATFSGALPTAFALHAAYPNPFNPTTTLGFDLPRAAQVRLAIYDVSGRRIRTLVDGWREAASHTAIWDGTTDAGQRAASGTYYGVLAADGRRETRKLTLVK